MKLARTVISAFLFCFLTAQACLLQADDPWLRVGSARAAISAEKATIAVDDDIHLQQIRLYVSDGDINLVKVKLIMKNNQFIIQGIQKLVMNGQYSRAIPLTSEQQQSLKRVEIFYKISKPATPKTDPEITLQGIPVTKL